MKRPVPLFLLGVSMVLLSDMLDGQIVPISQRGRADAERRGIHDGNNMRTEFWNYGMVGNYPPDPLNVDLTVFHSVEVPKGSGMNYTDGITPFVLAKIRQRNGLDSYIMETGFRERQGRSPNANRIMRFEPRPGYFQADPSINLGRSPAISNDPRTWPASWPDKELDPDDAGWRGSWNGYFGKRPAADQESFMVLDDDYYDAWDFYPDSRDTTRRGLGLRVEVRGFQWSNVQASNVIFWHYDITNESTTDYVDNIIFGLYMDSGVGGSALSCDGIAESDDDNAFFDRSFGLNLVYTWDKGGHGRDLSGDCGPTGYVGYAYLETPGKSADGVDNDDDGIVDEKRDGGRGQLIVGQAAIRQYVQANYNLSKFETFYGSLESRPAYKAGRWWTGDEDLDWVKEVNDVGADGVPGTNDTGEGDGMPTAGESNFDRTDLHESDQIGLTGFKMNRIRSLLGLPTDNVVFFTDQNNWPQRLYEQFTNSTASQRFDQALVLDFNIGFLFASGPFFLGAGQTERFSLALAYGADLFELRNTVSVVQAIYNANYQFATPPPPPLVTAEAGDGYVQLAWSDTSERVLDPLVGEIDFEGYKVYRSTDPDFRDPKIIVGGRGTSTIGHGKPLAQFDLKNGRQGFTQQTVEGIAFYLGNESGITHSYRDTSVTNGQIYYYAVTAYDYGPTLPGGAFTYYPSESPITVSRTLRGGLILPMNVVPARPNRKALGYTQAATDAVSHVQGRGSGSVSVRVVNSSLVPDDHVFKITFQVTPGNVHPDTYVLTDSTTQQVIFRTGNLFEGTPHGQTGAGLLPIVYTLPTILIDSTGTGFLAGAQTDARLKIQYQSVMSINQRREGFPDNLTITFSDTFMDTSVAKFPLPARPAKFQIVAHASGGDKKLKFKFFDIDGDGTISWDPGGNIEFIQVLTDLDTIADADNRVTWMMTLENAATKPPRQGDVYDLKLLVPFASDDMFVFQTSGEKIDPAMAKSEFDRKPYVVPNPYVASASFEPQRFAVSGRGDRRIEFRSLPQNCTIRIYTVRGDLVQTLQHDGSMNGFVAWNLRTKDNLEVAPGLYIYHVDAGDVGTHTGKFAVVK